MHSKKTHEQQFSMWWKTACCKRHQSIDRVWGRYQELVELGKSPRPRANQDLADVRGSKVHNSCFLPFSSPPPCFLADCSVSHAAVITSHPNVCVMPPSYFFFLSLSTKNKTKKKEKSELSLSEISTLVNFMFIWMAQNMRPAHKRPNGWTWPCCLVAD